ncbi:MAG: type IV pilus twitching motility protein PilT [Clostridiales bacterium]|nr:type IV pilus twitching motility protein PilT [Clostridiales bacterium]
MKLEKLLKLAIENERLVSDIHVAPGKPCTFRIDGELVPVDDKILEPKDTKSLAEELMAEKDKKVLEESGEVDFAYSKDGLSRCRVNVFNQRGTLAIALRLLTFDIPKPEDLGLPNALVNLTSKRRGLVLVTGVTGSGKSTTLASLIHNITTNYNRNIITLEDPIEYLHKHGKSMVVQREIGTDTFSYGNALRAALRQDPDVILVGEMRDLETISIAVTAAETGHLVFSTLHTNNAVNTIDRILDVFPPYQQPQIRVQLAGVLECIISQQLLPKSKGGRVAAFEVLLANPAVRNLIRDAKAYQIPNVMQTCRKEGMILMDDAILEIYKKGEIDIEIVLSYCQDVQSMKKKLNVLY